MSATCPICRSKRSAHYFSDQHLTLVRCRECGVKFQHPMLTPEELTALYTAGYYEEHYPARHIQAQKRLFDTRLQSLEQLMALPQGRLLDIGSGRGVFLTAAMVRGWECRGLETSPEAAEQSGRNTGITIDVGSFPEHAPFDEQSFDLVHMNHVLEHLRDPALAMQKICALLKPGGLFYCEVPRQNNLLNALSSLLGRKDFGFTYFPGHLYLFGRRSMRQLMKDAGLTVVDMRVEGLESPHRFERGVHYQSAWTHLVVRVCRALRLSDRLGGGNLVVVARKSPSGGDS